MQALTLPPESGLQGSSPHASQSPGLEPHQIPDVALHGRLALSADSYVANWGPSTEAGSAQDLNLEEAEGLATGVRGNSFAERQVKLRRPVAEAVEAAGHAWEHHPYGDDCSFDLTDIFQAWLSLNAWRQVLVKT